MTFIIRKTRLNPPMEWIALFVTGYLTLCLVMALSQRRFLFHPVHLDNMDSLCPKGACEKWTLEREDARLQGWRVFPDRNRWILYFGGNAEDVSGRLADFVERPGFAALLVNYRGYGASSGRPGQKEILADALAVYDAWREQLTEPPREIILYGRSLGSSVAAYVAAHRPADKLVLVTPFDSIRNLARKRFPWLPVGLLLRHPFETTEYIRNWEGPTLVALAEHDETVPGDASERLLKTMPGPAQVVTVNGADHNSILETPPFPRALSQFLSTPSTESAQ